MSDTVLWIRHVNESWHTHPSVRDDPMSHVSHMSRMGHVTHKNGHVNYVNVPCQILYCENVICHEWVISNIRMCYVYYMNVPCQIQGGEDARDAPSCRSFFAKGPRIIGLFCGKWSMKIRHPMTLRHSVLYCEYVTWTSHVTHIQVNVMIRWVMSLICHEWVISNIRMCYIKPISRVTCMIES